MVRMKRTHYVLVLFVSTPCFAEHVVSSSETAWYASYDLGQGLRVSSTGVTAINF